MKPLSDGYIPELNTTPELKADRLQYYQELVGVLLGDVYIDRVDILLEVSMMLKLKYIVLDKYLCHML